MILSSEEIEKRVADSYELPNEVLKEVPEPIVSIRTSTYNHGPYIKQCIEGVLMQKTSFPFEYIIGEDFSTDETRKIVFEYAKKYPKIIRVVTADYNVGSKANGQRCIRRCRGKYMAICEGDDYWIDSLKLQKQVDYLENNLNCGICYTQAQIYNQNKGIFDENIGGGKYVDYKNLLIWNPIMTVTVLFRKDLFLSYQKDVYPENQKWRLGDYPLWLWIAMHSDVHFMNEITSVYRCVNNSASHQTDIKKQELFNRSILEIRLFYLKKYPIPDFPKDKIYDDFYRRNSVAGILCRDRQYAYDNMRLMKNKSFKQLIKMFLCRTKLGFFLINKVLRSQYNYGI